MARAAAAVRGVLRQSDRHPILAGIGTNFIAEFARAATLPVIAIIAARYLGAANYGVLATGQVLVGLAAALTGFGLLYAILQLGSRRDEELSALLTTGVLAALASAAVMYGGLFLWVWAFSYDTETQRVTMALGLSLFATALNGQLGAGLQVQGRYPMIAVAGIISTVFNAVYAIAVIAADRGVLALAWSPVVGGGSNAIVLLYALRSEFRPRVSLSLARRLFGIGWPFGLNDFLYLIYFSIDIVILSLISTDRQVGLYNVPVRIIVVMFLLPMVVFNRVLYPRFFDWTVNDRERLREVYLLSSKGILVLGLVAGALLITFAAPGVPFVFGDSFHDSIVMLQVLALAVPLRYFLSASSTVLATSGLNRERLILIGAAAAVNIALCFSLIPFFDAMGAAVATVLGEALYLTGVLWIVHSRALKADLVRDARLPLLAVPAGLIVAAVVAGRYEAWAAGVCGGLAIASLVLLLGPFGYLKREELFGKARVAPERGSLAD